MGNQVETVENRENWGSRFGFIMAATGVAVGIGNIQRFPYLVGENGGAAFVVAYLIIMTFCTIPLTIMEIGAGHKFGKGVIDTYVDACRGKTAGKVLGGYISIIPILLNMYYLCVITYVAYYIYSSFVGGWHDVDTTQLYNQVISSKGMLAGIFIGVCLLNSLIVFGGITNGIDKACRIMIPGVFLTLLIVLIRAAFLPGFGEGLKFFMSPDWSKLLDPNVWLAAAGQSMFSIGVGPGMMIVYGSHLKKDDDVNLNAVTICFLDTAVAVLAGLAIVPATVAMGFDTETGPALLFVVLPALFDRMAGGRILGVIFFLGVFFAGLSSSISHLESPTSSFMDRFGWSRKKTVLIFTVIELIGGLICCVTPSVYNFISAIAGDYFYSLSALISVIVFAYVYGAKKIRNYTNSISDIQVGRYYDILLKFVACPVLALVVLNMFI
ncbi:MAG: sodium-dependent transporter [Anaerovoracaceae bacterium]|jgi:NSS family neurotransmitter:Na+ symporter